DSQKVRGNEQVLHDKILQRPVSLEERKNSSLSMKKYACLVGLFSEGRLAQLMKLFPSLTKNWMATFSLEATVIGPNPC
ncbi:hypothetical protein KRR55_19845, partial [Paeniglutamicibacter sp. ABSL32-1]|uniref:hypothetical protein n=1 Tax=Paeniglutamicibacter quisquiliarum TaxID=2849498 RepID=UPI001C2CD565